MLAPHETVVGNFALAPDTGLTLMLPRSQYEQPMLIAGLPKQKMAIFLGEEFRFHGLSCGDQDNLEGLLIPEVQIELDEVSIFNPADRGGLPPGALIREGTVLNIMAHVRDGRHGFDRLQRVAVLAGLPACAEREAAAFRRWQIVLGEGDDKRVLREVSLLESPA